MQIADAEIERHPRIRRVEIFHFNNRPGKAVRDRHIHRARERDGNVACVDIHGNTRARLGRDARHAQFEGTEKERRDAGLVVVMMHTRFERGGELEPVLRRAVGRQRDVP